MSMVERSCEKEAGSTKPLREIPVLPIGRMLEEFFTGICQDTNMAEMVYTFNQNQEEPVIGEDYWTSIGASPEEKLEDWFNGHHVEEEQLIRPTFGSYKTSFGDNSV